MLGGLSQADDTVSNYDNTDSCCRISDIKNRPDLKMNKIGNVAQTEAVNQVAYRATDNHTNSRQNQHTIKKRPATAQEKDQVQNDSNTDKINND